MTPLVRLVLFASALLALSSAAQAQINVGIEIKRHFYLRHEPLIANVTVTNLSGRDLVLSDGEAPWFGFQITHGAAENLLSPRNPNYTLDPLEVKIGETLKRQVNLTELYPITEYGTHRIRATIYSKELGKYFSSRAAVVQITEGRVIWQQAVGVPETMANAGDTHRVTLLAVQGPKHSYLYCRIEDPDTGVVFCTYRLGNMIDNTKPQAEFDSTNTLHVLHLVGPKTYYLSQIGVNGDFHGQFTYSAPKLKPSLRRDASGSIAIAGATRVRTVAAAETAEAVPKLSDRPAGLPRR